MMNLYAVELDLGPTQLPGKIHVVARNVTEVEDLVNKNFENATIEQINKIHTNLLLEGEDD